MRFAIFGAGALGGCLGARLAADGNEVVFVARGVQREALSAQGLELLAPDGDVHVKPVALYEDPASAGFFDFVLFCVRDSQIDACIELVPPLLATDSAVLVLQSGMRAFRRFEQLVDRSLLMGAYAELDAERVEPGVVQQISETAGLVVGELDGESSWRLECLQAACGSAGIGVRVSDDINREMWRHFVCRCAMEVSAALNRCAVAEIAAHPEARSVFEILFTEGCAVAARHGVDLSEDGGGDAVLSRSAATASRLRADLEKGLPMEVEAFAGELVRLGKEKGVEVTVFERGYGALAALVPG